MKKKEKQSLKELHTNELIKKIKETEQEFVQMLNATNKDKKNSRLARTMKRKLAVLYTFLREKDLVHE